MCVQIVSVLGFLVSLYALYVKIKMKRDRDYRPVCDIRDNISCTRALGSRYGSTLGLPNPLYGLLFYPFVFILSFTQPQWLIYPAAAAVLFSLYLAFISYVIQRNFCLVCTAIYLINLALLLC
jgi:vitamin-K-epoxide reductase (warfarin-sensitive)